MQNQVIDPATVSVGTILYSSWGYEQTNITFYQLVRKSGKALYLRKLHNENVIRGAMSGTVIPKKDHFKSEEFRKLLKSPQHYIKHDDYEFLQLWDGSAMEYTAYY